MSEWKELEPDGKGGLQATFDPLIQVGFKTFFSRYIEREDFIESCPSCGINLGVGAELSRWYPHRCRGWLCIRKVLIRERGRMTTIRPSFDSRFRGWPHLHQRCDYCKAEWIGRLGEPV